MSQKSTEVWNSTGDKVYKPVVIVEPESGLPITSFNGGTITTTQLPIQLGQKTASNSLSVVLSSDGPFTSNFGVTSDSVATTDTGTFSFISLFKRNLQTLTNISGLLPTSIGQKTSANSLSVTLSSDGPFATNFGLQADSAASSDTGTFSFLSLFKRNLQSLTTIAGQLPASLGIKTASASLSVAPASDGVFPVIGKPFRVSAEFSRPANTTAYSANQVVADSTSAATILQFDIARITGGSGWINKIRIETNSSTDTSQYRLHLFHTAPTMLNDGSAFTLLWANRAKRIIAIDFDAMVTEGTGSDAAKTHYISPFFFNCAAGDTKVYAILETLTARTPVSGQGFYVELAGEQN